MYKKHFFSGPFHPLALIVFLFSSLVYDGPQTLGKGCVRDGAFVAEHAEDTYYFYTFASYKFLF